MTAVGTKLCAAAFLLQLSVLATSSVAQHPLELEISFPKTAYVLREPVKVRAVLRNASSETVQVMEVRYLGPDMENFYLEVQPPSGGVQKRRTRYFQMTEVANTAYVGEALKPGEALLTFMYPTQSAVESTTDDSLNPWTFSTAGRYRVRLVYAVSQLYSSLRYGDGLIRSNEVELSFRAADNVENSILDALWTDDGWPIPPETSVYRVEDTGRLRSIIEKYPTYELTNYVRQRLANALSLNTEPEAALELLRDLEVIAPTFRVEEVRILMARNLGSLGRHEEAVDLLEDLMQRDPLLRTNYVFMWTYLNQRYPTASKNPATQWRANRLKGMERPEEMIQE